MKLEDWKKPQPNQMKEFVALNDVFNKVMLHSEKGQAFFLTRVLQNARWLFVMPVEYIEQLIPNLEQRETDNPTEQRAKETCIKLIRALIPVKKLLDEQWKDIELEHLGKWEA